MENIKITPSELKGAIHIPPSKSLSHRAVIAAGLAKGSSKIDNILNSDDILATSKAMEALGISMSIEGESLVIKGADELRVLTNKINCIESGSTLRFLIPLALLTGEDLVFEGRGKLKTRPLDAYFKIFDQQNINYEYPNELPLKVQGKLKPGEFEITGDVSSQFITGLMFALPLLNGDSKIIITSPLESKGYVDLTLDILKRFGVEIQNEDYRIFHIKGNQKYSASDYRVEGDYSQAAFWLVAGTLAGEIECLDINEQSFQGDKVIVDIIKKMGGNIVVQEDSVKVKASKTHGITIDAAQCPDIVPILAVLAALSDGETKIINAGRLRIKESDRLKAVTTELNKLGGHVIEKEDGLVIYGKEILTGGIVDSWDDHRIAMAMAIASIRCKEPVIITNSHAVSKSYPGFFQDFKMLGGKFHEWSMG